MKFIDLFAGLGGFNLALSQLGHTCAFASEIDPELRELYVRNFGISPFDDIRDADTSDIPRHDILCAGFPCQPYSKAGSQFGRCCPSFGDLFDDHLIRILRLKRPRYLLLENVPNLVRHRGGKTWKKMCAQLRDCGYEIDTRLLSPHQFGIPQIRERMFVVGQRGTLRGFEWPKIQRKNLSIRSVLDVRPPDAKSVPDHVNTAIDVWQDFLDRSPTDLELPSFPIWAMEFGADYPFENMTPCSAGTRRLVKYRGEFGVHLRKFSPSERMLHLPKYAQTDADMFPNWKIDFIRKNRAFFAEHRKWIRPWLKQVKPLQTSHQKLEWNCKGEKKDLSNFILQFRPSGMRTKRPDTAPSLVAMSTTQVPVVAWERRFITPRECSRLQSLGKLRHLPEFPSSAYRALGNAVNAKIVQLIAKSLLCPTRAVRRPAKRRKAA